jgi:hypothetical protein
MKMTKTRARAERCLIQRIERLANQPPVTRERLAKNLGLKNPQQSVSTFLSCARLIPWVQVDIHDDGTITTRIDDKLRQICEWDRGRPAIGGVSVTAFLRELRSEITRRRQANHDKLNAERWNPEAVIKRFQTELLDWIENKLDEIDTPSLRSPHRHVPKEEVRYGISQNQSRGASVNAEVSK